MSDSPSEPAGNDDVVVSESEGDASSAPAEDSLTTRLERIADAVAELTERQRFQTAKNDRRLALAAAAVAAVLFLALALALKLNSLESALNALAHRSVAGGENVQAPSPLTPPIGAICVETDSSPASPENALNVSADELRRQGLAFAEMVERKRRLEGGDAEAENLLERDRFAAERLRLLKRLTEAAEPPEQTGNEAKADGDDEN